jgi:putative oxidoreductase
MERFLGKYEAYIYAIMRFVIGVLFAMHGAQKLFGWPVAAGGPASALTTTAGVIELVAGLLIAVGLFAGFAAFLASGEMAVAYFMVHAPGGLWPIVNKGELAVVYCFIFLYIAARGSGTYSLERLAKKT